MADDDGENPNVTYEWQWNVSHTGDTLNLNNAWSHPATVLIVWSLPMMASVEHRLTLHR